MGLFSLFKVKGRTEPLIVPQPEPPTRPLTELADEYIALMGPYDRSVKEVRQLERRLRKLMEKHGIEYIARKGCLLCNRWFWGSQLLEITPLPARLDGSAAFEAAPAKHLIPLVDRLLEADGGYQANKGKRKAMWGELAKAMARAGLDSFLYRGYRFERKGAYYCSIQEVTDFNG